MPPGQLIPAAHKASTRHTSIGSFTAQVPALPRRPVSSCQPVRQAAQCLPPALDTAGSYAVQQEEAEQQQLAAAGPDGPPSQLKQRLSECPVCGGTGRVSCRDCKGQGVLPRGGYSRKNPLNMSRAVGSKWTALAETLGWRHFRVTAVRRFDGTHKQQQHVYLLLQASCDSSAQVWVNALALRNRSCWAAGWLQMSELTAEAEGGASTGHKCHSCAGLGFRACAACDGRGRADLVEV